MQEMADMELVRLFAERNSDEAFATLVTRHVNLVYSAALRKTGNAHAAEEITQAVFIILAQKAGRLSPKTILSGWLYQAARLTSSSFLRTEIRRARREQEAYMQSLVNETEPELWPQMAPMLDDAMGRLREKDRNAIALRFFEGKNFQEIGAAFGASENAAKKRVAHALEKLHRYFSKRGIFSTTAIIAGTMAAHAVQAAPPALAKAVTAVAVTKGSAATISTLTLITGALKIMAWTKAKTVIVTGVGVLLTGGITTILMLHYQDPIVRGKRAIANHLATPIDLTAHYSTPASYFDQITDFPAWKSVPRGFEVFDHVPLQIGGQMCLWSERAESRGLHFPEQFLDIAVNQKFETLYIYHGAFFASPDKTPVCDVVFRYTDGSSVTNQLLYGIDILDWNYKRGRTGFAPTAPRSKLAWVGGTATPGKKEPLRFCLTAIENPQPAIEVETIDLISCKNRTTACILALTTGKSGLMDKTTGPE